MNLAAIRLHNQQISNPRFGRAEEVVAWLGGMQGQDYAGVKWSIGLRLPNASDTDIERAIAERKILRTWPMRGTLHFVAAADVHWLLALTAPKNIAGSARRRQQLDLDEATLSRCRKIFAKALSGGKQKTRDELYALLERAKIRTDGQRGYHILWNTAIQGLICFAALRDGEQTFALLDEWVAPTPAKAKDEALAELAHRYFASHGPATLQDFAWWSGLSAGDARAGLEASKFALMQEDFGGQNYWMLRNQDLPVKRKSPRAFALPGFDEYLLGYRDRSAVLDSAHAAKICPGGNGVFAATMVIDGQVVGTWKRRIGKSAVDVVANPFVPLRDLHKREFRKAAERYATFLGVPPIRSSAATGPRPA